MICPKCRHNLLRDPSKHVWYCNNCGYEKMDALKRADGIAKGILLLILGLMAMLIFGSMM